MEGKPAQEITIGEAVDGVSTDSLGATLETLCIIVHIIDKL